MTDVIFESDVPPYGNQLCVQEEIWTAVDALKVHEGCSQMLIVEELGCKRMASFQDGHLLTTESPPHPFNTKTM